jgi:hypothetical protein
MSTTTNLNPSVTLRRGADRHQTRIGWLHGRHWFDTGIDLPGQRRLAASEPSEVLIWEMHAFLGPATRQTLSDARHHLIAYLSIISSAIRSPARSRCHLAGRIMACGSERGV